jgi:DNA-binding CsgD family transcriptional regulator
MQIEGKMVVEDLRHLAAGLPSGEYEVLLIRKQDGVISIGNPAGSKKRNVYLTQKQKDEVKNLYIAGELTPNQIAAQYNVSTGTVYRLRRRGK